MAQLVLPRVQAMVVCDRVKESETEPGVFSLSGVRAFIGASSFPAFCPLLRAFVHMSGHQGIAFCHVEVNRLETDETIYRTPTKKITFKGPTVVVPVMFRVRNCVFPAPGLYYVQVFHEGKMIAERPLELLQEE
jgi:uncharacterized protein DUF6941